MSLPALPDVPPYQLQHILSNVNELLGGSRTHASSERPSSRTAHGTVEVRCAQALGSEIYVGCSDGSLLRYAFIDSLASSEDSYQLLTHQTLPSGKAIEQIALAPSVERALVLCDNQIHFFSLPNLEPVQHINPVRRVVTFALDESRQRKSPPEHRSYHPQPVEPVRLCVIKPNAIFVFALRDRLLFQKEIPLPNGATLARLSNQYLCIADHETYNVINLETANLIPLILLNQGADAPAMPIKPSITLVSEDEFLVLSWSGQGSLGVFIMGDGEAVRGTLEWETHPAALSCDYPYVTSVLPNGTIEVQSLETKSPCQIIPPLTGFTAARLNSSFTGFVVPFGEQVQKLDVLSFQLLEPDTPNTSEIEDGAVGSVHENDPGRLPRRSVSMNALKKDRTARQPKASVLVVGTDAVYALVKLSVIQQADALLDAHKLKETADLAKERQKQISQGQSGIDVQRQTEELHYVYQRLGYTCLSETLFEEAGNHLFRGNVDPRMLIRLFSTLRGTLLIKTTPSLPVFAGLASQVRGLGTIDTIIVMNLVKNYTPHLQPNTRSAPPTSELRKLLMVSAREMLRGYLHKWKNKVKYGGEPVIKEVSQAIDTVLVKLFAESENTEELYALIDSSEDIVMEEVEVTLIDTGQYNALIKLCRRRGDSSKLLSILAKLVEGEWSDEDVKDPLGQMMALLKDTRDRALLHRWGIWLVQRDAQAGLKLLMSDNSRGGDDGSLLDQLESVSPEAGQQFLEYLVLEKRSNDPNFHTRLAHILLDRLVATVQSEPVLEYYRNLALEYSIQSTSTPFLVYLATASTSSPHYKQVRTRCRAALFLQGSSLYDAKPAREKLNSWEEVLQCEVAILNGRLGHHTEVLKALVHTLRDTASADAYCALGGSPLSPKVAQVIGEQLDLHSWAAFVIDGARGSRKPKGQKKKDLEETRQQLFKVLLEVYMSGSGGTEGHAARLLNSQGGNMEVLDVVALVPPSWSLNVVSSFLARSLRKSMHDRFEGEILKAISLGQNLEVRDRAYTLLHAQGAFIEEPIDGSPPSSLRQDGSEAGALVTDADGEKVLVIPSEPISEKVILKEVHVPEATEERRNVGDVT